MNDWTSANPPPMWEKQKYALKTITDRGDAGSLLLMEMGTGKSRVTIRYMERLFSQGAKMCYICAPLSVMGVWVHEWDLWAKAPVCFIDLHATGQAGIIRAQELSEAGFPVICLVNYDTARRIGYGFKQKTRKGESVKVWEKTGLAMHDVSWDIGILDESTKIKTRGSATSQFFRHKMRPVTQYRLCLTGSAYTKRPLDAWAQVLFACGPDSGILPPRYEEFFGRVAIPHPYIRGAVIGYHNLDWLASRLSLCAVLLKKEDVLDLPPLTHTYRYVRLGKESKRVYHDLRDEMYTELEALEADGQPINSVTAEHIFKRLNKFIQITSGYIKPDPPDEQPSLKMEPVRLGTEKLDALLEVLEDRLDEHTLIVVQYDEEERIVREGIEKRFKLTPKILNGSVQGAMERTKMISAAANDPFFIVKESVGCRGADMRWADLTIFYSHRYDTEAFEQMVSRNHRGGQTRPITALHIVAEGTYDEKVLAGIQKDLDLARQIELSWRSLLGGDLT